MALCAITLRTCYSNRRIFITGNPTFGGLTPTMRRLKPELQGDGAMRHLYIEHVVQIVEAIITNNHTRSLTPAIRGLKPRLQRDGAMAIYTSNMFSNHRSYY
jgi:hypothetical protein